MLISKKNRGLGMFKPHGVWRRGEGAKARCPRRRLGEKCVDLLRR
jgi:hypothetical protein